MNKYKFAGEEYDGEMTLKEFVKSLEMRSQDFLNGFKIVKVNKDDRLKEICNELEVQHNE